MKLDRLVVDLLDWIRRWLWAKEARSPQPYKAVRESVYDRGVLKMVTGRDTPRAVYTWIFSPKAQQSEYLAAQQRPKDFHIYLDWSAKLPEFSDRGTAISRSLKKPTHTITILTASHSLLPNGEYDVEYVFSGDYNFAAGATDLNRAARMACFYTAILVALYEIREYRWPEEMAQIFYKVTRVGKPVPNTYAYKEFGE